MVEKLNNQNIYHSDLHQNNLLCDLNGNVKLFDYDLSSFLPKYDSRILEDYEFDIKLIYKYLKKYKYNLITNTIILECMDKYYILYVTELADHLSDNIIDKIFNIKDINKNHKYWLKRIYNDKKKLKDDINDFTKRAILSVLLFYNK